MGGFVTWLTKSVTNVSPAALVRQVALYPASARVTRSTIFLQTSASIADNVQTPAP